MQPENVFVQNAKSVFPDGTNGNGQEEHNDWCAPQPIDRRLLKVQTLPFKILPEPFRPWIRDVSHRMQCPPDFVVAAVLTLVGSVIGTRCGIHPKQLDDWLVIPNLWGGAVGVYLQLLKPLH